MIYHLLKKKSALLTRVRPKDAETTLAIISRNELKYREWGTYKIIARSGEGTWPMLGFQKGLPKVSSEELLLGENQEAPVALPTSTIRCHRRSIAPEAATSAVCPLHRGRDWEPGPVPKIPRLQGCASPWNCARVDRGARSLPARSHARARVMGTCGIAQAALQL